MSDLTPAEQAVAEILWRRYDGDDYDPEDGGHARAVADLAEPAREVVAAVLDALGGIVLNIEPASSTSTVNDYAIGFSAGLRARRRGGC